jgi:hypothetical protein
MTDTLQAPTIDHSLAPPPTTRSCDFCQELVSPDALYHRLEIAMNERGGMDRSVVEEETELIVCVRCEPVVAQKVDRLLTELWAMMDEPTSL